MSAKPSKAKTFSYAYEKEFEETDLHRILGSRNILGLKPPPPKKKTHIFNALCMPFRPFPLSHSKNFF